MSHNGLLSGNSGWHTYLDTLLHCSFPLHKCSLTKLQRTMRIPDIVTKPPLPISARHSWSLELSIVTILIGPCIVCHQEILNSSSSLHSHYHTLLCSSSFQPAWNKASDLPQIFLSCPQHFLPMPLWQGVCFLWSPTPLLSERGQSS